MMTIAKGGNDAAQTQDEVTEFIEAFAQITVACVKSDLLALTTSPLPPAFVLNWSDQARLAESGLTATQAADPVIAASRYLHIDLACDPAGRATKARFLGFTGLSPKQQKTLFPALCAANPPEDRAAVSREVARLNAWLDWIREDSFDPAVFINYRQHLEIHGRTQNVSGAIGATGAVIAFVDAIRALNASAITDNVGDIPPEGVKSPLAVFGWRNNNPNATTKAILLRNGRALVFSSSKDVNIFQPLGEPFLSAMDALTRFNSVKNDQATRSQTLHEFAVGEIKTATDPSNLHERMGLASRETQTELRTDRFLMMAILNEDILDGGVQHRRMNNRDLTRFSHIFNLHHCWGWDGGRERHTDHWQSFVNSVKTWCGL